MRFGRLLQVRMLGFIWNIILSCLCMALFWLIDVVSG